MWHCFCVGMFAYTVVTTVLGLWITAGLPVILLKGKVENETSHLLNCFLCLNILVKGNWVFCIRNSLVKTARAHFSLGWVKISRCVFVYFHVLVAGGNWFFSNLIECYCVIIVSECHNWAYTGILLQKEFLSIDPWYDGCVQCACLWPFVWFSLNRLYNWGRPNGLQM